MQQAEAKRGTRQPFDEMGAGGICFEQYALIERWLAETGSAALDVKRREAEILFRRIGITFSVYAEGADPERLIPFDIIPRILTSGEWTRLARGLEQRVKALNAYLGDIYHAREIIAAGIVPESVLLEEGFRPEMQGFDPPGGVYTHVAGIDIVRVGRDEFFVLEDNCRTPSGVSYMIENREAMMRLFPDLCARHRIAPVSHYAEELHETLRSVAPPNCEGEPTIAVLTPGACNSAYYEHSFLADEMGVELVEGADLVVEDNVVYMRTTEGPKRLDVIYRRIDDDYLDPLSFLPDSLVGVPGLFGCYRSGNLTLANAVGTGCADDKAIYPYVPEMIRFYLGEEPLLSNVPTYRCGNRDDLAYVLEHIGPTLVEQKIPFDVMMLLGGEIKGDMRLFQIYAAGNFIEATQDTPFLQIGEHKYGKPILDRVVTYTTDLYDGVKLVLISMDSTLRSNLTVGMPVDLLVYRRGTLTPEVKRRLSDEDAYFKLIRDSWSTALREAYQTIPRPNWAS